MFLPDIAQLPVDAKELSTYNSKQVPHHGNLLDTHIHLAQMLSTLFLALYAGNSNTLYESSLSKEKQYQNGDNY